MRITTITNLVLNKIETSLESSIDLKGKELYNVKEIISYKIIKEVRYYRIK